jgi:hypothetical protein
LLAQRSTYARLTLTRGNRVVLAAAAVAGRSRSRGTATTTGHAEDLADVQVGAAAVDARVRRVDVRLRNSPRLSKLEAVVACAYSSGLHADEHCTCDGLPDATVYWRLQPLDGGGGGGDGWLGCDGAALPSGQNLDQTHEPGETLSGFEQALTSPCSRCGTWTGSA